MGFDLDDQLERDGAYADDPDDALLIAVKEMVLEEIQPEWATLSADPARVAERIAKRFAPMLGERPDADEIRGRPWASRG